MPTFILKPQDQYNNPIEKLQTHSCVRLFNNFQIDAPGNVHICCDTWLPDRVGNLLEMTADELFNSKKIKDIVDDMQKGKFSYCNDLCPTLNDFLHDRHQQFIIPQTELDAVVSTQPFNITLSYDPSCNLQCPSCRNELIVLDVINPVSKYELHLHRVHTQAKRLIELLLETKNEVIVSITGSGDPFASALYWNYIKELAQEPIPHNLRITLTTNGLLMTEKNWNEIKSLWPYIVGINVSIDAATEETYKIVRKNGVFSKLKKNLDLLDQMIVGGCFPRMASWQTRFVVQKENYTELKSFVEWQLSYESKPSIWTHLVAHWSHMTDAQYAQLSVRNDLVIQSELKDIIKDPIFNNPQIMLGNLSSMT